MKEGWVCEPGISDPYKRLDELLRNTAKFFMAWGQKKIGNVKIQMATTRLVIKLFDKAMEDRSLTAEERWLRGTLKKTLLGLASLERMIARQRSRIKWLQEGDANSKFFQLFANGSEGRSSPINMARRLLSIRRIRRFWALRRRGILLSTCNI